MVEHEEEGEWESWDTSNLGTIQVTRYRTFVEIMVWCSATHTPGLSLNYSGAATYPWIIFLLLIQTFYWFSKDYHTVKYIIKNSHLINYCCC